jgi:hypothetical protein
VFDLTEFGNNGIPPICDWWYEYCSKTAGQIGVIPSAKNHKMGCNAPRHATDALKKSNKLIKKREKKPYIIVCAQIAEIFL